MPTYIPYGKQWIDETDVEAVNEVLRSDWLTTGPYVAAFERALTTVGGVEHAVAVNSGTAALHAAYEAVGVGPGDEVIVPPMTFSATANAARYLGATVRFADVLQDDLTIDPAAVSKLVNEKTRAICAVDFAGHAADYDALRQIADDAGVALIADAAHSIGGAYKGRPVGCLADITCYSFHPVKTVTTGEGGAVLTDNARFAERIREFRSHGIVRGVSELPGGYKLGSWGYDIEALGYNYRITDFQCALGTNQLEKLPRWIKRRQEISGMYRTLLADSGIELPSEKEWCHHAYHLFTVRLDAARRLNVFEELKRSGIGVQVHYIPVNMLSSYQALGYRPTDTPVALGAYERIFSLPCFPRMSDDDVEMCAEALKGAFGA